MKTITDNKKNTISIRQKAEEIFSSKQDNDPDTVTEADAASLLHELQVHQIELEMQNEELQIALDNAQIATDKYTTLYDFAPTGYFTLDSNGIISDLNLSGAKMLGMDRFSLIKKNIRNFICRDSKDIFNNFFTAVFENDSKQSCELKLQNVNNQSIYIYLEGIVSEVNQFCLITAVDITDRQKAVEALKESETHLRELNATKDKFFTLIAHDLRNPFTSIIGFSSFLIEQIERKDLDNIDKYAKIIYSSSLRAMELLKNLMEWAQLQTGKINFEPKPIELSHVIDNITDLLIDTAQQKTISIIKEVPPTLNVFADEEMISTVLRNLISNAIKFTKPGGEILIQTQQITGELIVAVIDNGIGVDKENLEKLFMIEGNHSTKGTNNEDGTGLGLILCKEFILKHSGKIWVDSEPGKGSKFYFTIPNA